MTCLSLIAAMDENRLIGAGNQLPWHMPADLALFKRITMGKPIIMGRKTYESIGRPLPGRRNIVVSRDSNYQAPGCELCHGIEAALALCADDEEVMLIGGASLYEQAVVLSSCMYITRIHHRFNGDTWFPEFSEEHWRIEENQEFEADKSNPYSFSFVKYVRELANY